jgi:hypothetical protein
MSVIHTDVMNTAPTTSKDADPSRVDPLMGGTAPTAVNQTTEPIQRELLQALGLGDRISVQ